MEKTPINFVNQASQGAHGTPPNNFQHDLGTGRSDELAPVPQPLPSSDGLSGEAKGSGRSLVRGRRSRPEPHCTPHTHNTHTCTVRSEPPAPSVSASWVPNTACTYTTGTHTLPAYSPPQHTPASLIPQSPTRTACTRPPSPVEVIRQSHGQQGDADPREEAG